MRVREYVEYAAKLRGLNSIQTKARANEIYEQLALGDQRERLIGNLSKGYRQRVALAQAIVHDPDVLVLDEPTEGLDPTQIVHIRELIRSLAGKHTIILSSHILSEVQNVCDHIVIISKGKIVQEGSYDELVAELGAGKLFRMQVEHNGSALLEGARRVRGIANVQMIDDGLEFAVSEQQAIDELLKLAVSGGHGVRYLAPKKKSLEDVFFQLTGSAQQEAQ
jgi:ABC-2 type transport system ATP-binding protein